MSKSKKRMQAALDIYKEKIIAERLNQLNVDGQILEPITITNVDMATAKETLGKAIGGFIPYVLVMFIFLGAMYPAIDLGAGLPFLQNTIVSNVLFTTVLFGSYYLIQVQYSSLKNENLQYS